MRAVTDTNISSWKAAWKFGMIVADLSGRYHSRTCLMCRVEADGTISEFCDTGPKWCVGRVTHPFDHDLTITPERWTLLRKQWAVSATRGMTESTKRRLPCCHAAMLPCCLSRCLNDGSDAIETLAHYRWRLEERAYLPHTACGSNDGEHNTMPISRLGSYRPASLLNRKFWSVCLDFLKLPHGVGG